MSKKVLSLLAALVLMAALPTQAFANAATMYVYSSNHRSVHLRSEPRTNRDNIVADVEYGTAVDVTGYTGNGSWAHVTLSNGKQGYMMTRYLTVDVPSGKPASSTNTNTNTTTDVQLPDFSHFKKVDAYDVVVRPSKPNGYVNFRWAPSMQCKVAMRCYANYPLQVIAQDNNWVQVVDNQTGYVGFMYRKFVTPVTNDAQIGQGAIVNQ